MSDASSLPEGDIQVQAVGLNQAGTPIPGVVFQFSTTVGTLTDNGDGTETLNDTTPGDVTVTATAPNGVSGQATGTIVDSVVASVQVNLTPGSAPGAAPAQPDTSTPAA
jgi:hypothetical protein